MDDHMSSHPAARLFPLIKGDEFEALVDDIREHGQREPILLHPDGSILDGRNRYLACQKLGLEPKSEHWDGEGSPEEIVLSLNLHRRHLSSAQRAAIAVEILPRLEAEAKERQRLSKGRGQKGHQKIDDLFDSEQTTENNELNDDSKSEQKAKRTKGEDVSDQSLDRAAKMFATNRNYVWWAKLIKDADPALLRKIRDGEMKIAVALRKLTRRRFPTPKQARRIAIDENRDVLARDGRRYGPPGEDPEKPPELDPGEQEALAFVDAVVTLGTLTLDPDDLAGKVPSWRRDEVENHLENAINCLRAFGNEWNQRDDDG